MENLQRVRAEFRGALEDTRRPEGIIAHRAQQGWGLWKIWATAISKGVLGWVRPRTGTDGFRTLSRKIDRKA